MKITKIIAAFGIVASMGLGTAASARDHYDRGHNNGWNNGHHNGWNNGRNHGWNNRYHGRHCRTEWRHHRRVTVC